MKVPKIFKNTSIPYLLIAAIFFFSSFLFFRFDYRYIDDYKLFNHNDTITGFLQSYKWGPSRIIGNYFFGLLYLPQSNVLINLIVLLVHLANGFIIFKLLSEKEGRNAQAIFCSLFFISIPITSEAFLWPIAGQVVFAVFFFLLGVLTHRNKNHSSDVRSLGLFALLFFLSISFYEVFILFPFALALFGIKERKYLPLAITLCLVSIVYLGSLKLYLQIVGSTLTQQQKTTPIALQDIPQRLSDIASDLVSISIGDTAQSMYQNSLVDARNGDLPIELTILLILFIGCAVVGICSEQIQTTTTTQRHTFFTILGLLIGLSLIGLLSIPKNYFHDLRTFYPFTVALTFFLSPYLSLMKKWPILFNAQLIFIVLLITLNVIVLHIENKQYADIYSYDKVLVANIAHDYQNGVETVIYLPGLDIRKPIETQMQLSYYPESTFRYGTHLLTATSIRFFTRFPYSIYGTRDQIVEKVKDSTEKFVVYDTVKRQRMSVSEFLNPRDGNQIDLTALASDQYSFREIPNELRSRDIKVIYGREGHKAIMAHPSCIDSTATLDLLLPELTNQCKLSFKILTSSDIHEKSQTDGVDITVSLNEQLLKRIERRPDLPDAALELYEFEIASQSAEHRLRFEIEPGRHNNCADDNVYITKPVLTCEDDLGR